MQRSFSIITTCKGRLEHLKRSLPRMLELGAAEIIVVDYSCPEGTGAYVREHFPAVRVVSVEGQEYFSNWRARNVGAAVATGDLLIFCDADTILAPNAIEWIAAHLPERSFGFLQRDATSHLNRTNLRLGTNQLRGFHVVPAKAFKALGGYDDVLEGYAAGGDTDLEQRLALARFKHFPIDPAIVEDVVEHGNEDRMKNHRDSIRVSYAAGLLYRMTKRGLAGISHKLILPPAYRRRLYDAALTAARNLGTRDTVALLSVAETVAVGMPMQLGYKKARTRISVKVELIGEEPVEKAPEKL
ncbi:MAG: glycosyltransferase family A protein [Sphingomicrobium sp.]